MVAGPEVARMVTELEKCVMETQASVGDHSHHEQCASVQTAFISEVASLTAVLEEMGNPFLEKSDDLLVLDTRDIMDRSVGDTVRRAETLGIQQYKKVHQGKVNRVYCTYHRTAVQKQVGTV